MKKKERNIELGKVLKDFRDFYGITGDVFSKKCKIAQSTISSIEKGKRECSMTTIEKYAHALDVCISDIITAWEKRTGKFMKKSVHSDVNMMKKIKEDMQNKIKEEHSND